MSRLKLSKYQKEMLKTYPNYFGAKFTTEQIELIKKFDERIKENNATTKGK
jgi:hypothetical protein